MEVVEREDAPLTRFYPEYLGGVPAVGHREYARGIALKKQVRIEHPAHCRSLGVADRVITSSLEACFRHKFKALMRNFRRRPLRNMSWNVAPRSVHLGGRNASPPVTFVGRGGVRAIGSYWAGCSPYLTNRLEIIMRKMFLAAMMAGSISLSACATTDRTAGDIAQGAALGGAAGVAAGALIPASASSKAPQSVPASAVSPVLCGPIIIMTAMPTAIIKTANIMPARRRAMIQRFAAWRLALLVVEPLVPLPAL
jgi:hypothetical protein